MTTFSEASVPQADPARRFVRFREEIADAVGAVIRSGQLMLGPNVEAFESAFAGYIGAAHCIGVNSGTDALAFALRAVGVGAGDEVVTVALSAAGTAQAILHCGATARFVDLDPASLCMDVDAAAAAIGPRTAAIVPVHLYGHPADVRRLRQLADRHGIPLVEDCAQAHGAHVEGVKLGCFGHAAAFSFYPTKNLGALGDGGAVVTGDPAVAARVRELRTFGWTDSVRISERLGFNSRLDEVQAAILLRLLPHLDASNAERRANADTYRSLLDGTDIALPPHAEGSVYHQFAVRHGARGALAAHLARNGIRTAVHYDPGLHHHPAFAQRGQEPLPVTEALSCSLLSLPIQGEVASSAVPRIAAAINGWVRP